MSPERLTPLIFKKDTKFLVSGESQISESFQFRLRRATFRKTISECCEAIYQVLSEKYLRSPKSPEEWKTIVHQFQDTWNLPFVIGAVDGKHVHCKLIPQLQGIF